MYKHIFLSSDYNDHIEREFLGTEKSYKRTFIKYVMFKKISVGRLNCVIFKGFQVCEIAHPTLVKNP